MSKSTGTRIGAIAILALGIGIGYFASKTESDAGFEARAELVDENVLPKLVNESPEPALPAETPSELASRTARVPKVVGAASSSDDGPINKQYVEAANPEEPAPFPHIDPPRCHST